MGLFLAMSGVIGADDKAVEQSLRSYANGREGTFEKKAGNTEDPDIAVVTVGGPNTTALYPGEFMEWDNASQHLSSELQRPVFSLHIHDGDLWMFVLFYKGEEVARFNPIPKYWAELDADEKATWAGDADLICRYIPELSPESIRNYFIEWSDEIVDGTSKAYPGDEFAYGVDWQITDFMRRVGLPYPIGDDGSINGQTFQLLVR